jgi:hypothetical protein
MITGFSPNLMITVVANSLGVATFIADILSSGDAPTK